MTRNCQYPQRPLPFSSKSPFAFILILGTLTISLLSACHKSTATADDITPAGGPGSGKTPGSTTKPIGSEQGAILFGDSLAVGFGAKKESVKPASCLQALTGKTSAVKAVSGSTTYQILQQIKGQSLSPYSLIFISAGGNDVIADRYGNGYSEEESVARFQDIIVELKDVKVPVVYLALNPPYSGTARLGKLSKLATAAGWKVVDGMSGFWGQKEYMSDQIHPNDNGYHILCKRLTEELKKKK